ncbi:MAG: PAS domain-containing protein [Nitrospirae bacterium]|nr:PAS domain-containing protein [Nitrospirota bacterium]MBF0536490.1 PAS domain-containing protein [Nitrospirota bacterium]MBF0617858.1 PAS domain-containing protein [Nitrospirota bacterium]
MKSSTSKAMVSRLPKSTASLSSVFKMVVLCVLFIDLFVATSGVVYLRYSKHQAEQRAAPASQNISLVLERYLNGFIGKIDIILIDISDEISNMLRNGAIDSKELTSFLTQYQRYLPEIETLTIADAHGIVTGKPQEAKINISDRDFFIAAQSSPKGTLIISKPMFVPFSKKWILTLARHINNPDGTFGGIVYANIALEHLIKVFATIDIGPHSGISLRDNEMAIIARYPQSKVAGSDIGNKILSPEFKRLLETGQTSGTFFTPTSFDNISKYVSYKKIAGYPLYITIGIASEDYLKEWKHECIVTPALIIILILGTLIFLYFVHRYIIYSKKIENALTESHNQLQEIIDNTIAVIFLKDVQGRYILINSRYEMLFHITKDAVIGKTDYDIFPKEAADSFRANDSEVIEKNMPLSFEEIVPHEDGIHIYISIKFPLYDVGGKIYAVCGIATDITRRKRMEDDLNTKTEQLQSMAKELEKMVADEIKLRHQKEQLLVQQSKMATMGEMISMITHQWKQPLNALSINIFDIKDAFEFGELNNEYIDKMVKTSKEQINFMAKTIDGFRNFLLPNKEKTTFNILDTINDLLYMFGNLYRKDNIEISTEVLCAESNLIFTGYSNELMQVVLNILNNAKDAILSRRKKDSPDFKGQIKIVISESGGNGVVSITDNGGGISEETINKIYEPYFSTKKQEGGTGLGLYMSKTIVETNMGGTLSVRNINGGAEFLISLNIKQTQTGDML